MAQDHLTSSQPVSRHDPQRARVSSKLWTPGSRRTDVADVLLQAGVEADDEIDGALRAGRLASH